VISQPNTNHPVSSEQRQTILVVDDEVIIRTAISEYLRDCGYKVIEAASVDEAVLVLQQGGFCVRNNMYQPPPGPHASKKSERALHLERLAQLRLRNIRRDPPHISRA
jgi:CheY-like chemotaxis protein